ncbi:MAG TPA: MOSC domain-containing protein [Candidatus Kapabacteria bacterium]|nr:MOSC domain-containing protein [Candidatus Kapabacteria bacterium]
MKIVSVNIAVPRTVPWKGKQITTGIYKEPVGDKRKVGFLGVEGDVVGDLQVHGGVNKAVYMYAAEHYDFWKGELPDMDMPFGMFGENVTVEGGLFENDVHVGDRFRLGTSEVMAIQPRMPCFKLGIKFGRDMIKSFNDAERHGIYFKVIKEGEMQTGDTMERIFSDQAKVSILDIVKLLSSEKENKELAKRALNAPALPEKLRESFTAIIDSRASL